MVTAIMELTIPECSLCARHGSKHFTYVNSFNPLNNLIIISSIVPYPLYRLGN